MKRTALAVAALTTAAGVTHAGGLDRTYTQTDIIFEEGNYAEISLGFVFPEVSGGDLLGNPISNVADDFGLFGAGVKLDFGGPMSFAMIYDQPYGADTEYGGNPATTLLGGTMADADTHAITALLKYQANDRVAFYGGMRAVKAEGEITLSGIGYSVASGYNVKFSSDSGVGYVVGGAYEIPDIAFRASLTYHSAVDLDFNTTENLPVTAGGPGVPVPTGATNSELPQSLELKLQSGIAKDTLLFGGIRWSEWSAFSLTPPLLASNLAQLDDTTTYEIGVGRRFSDKFSASIAVSYDEGGSDSLVSPLAPTNGETAVTLGGKYEISDAVSLSGGIRYTMLGNAIPEVGTPDTPLGSFSNNDALSAGLKLGFNF